MKSLLRSMLNSAEFLSDYGIRAFSKFREADPYIFRCCGNEFVGKYVPANRLQEFSAVTPTGEARIRCR